MNLFKLASFIYHHPLNREGRWHGLGRFVRWQLAIRLIGGAVALPFVNGTRLLASKGMAGATGNWYCGLHEAEDMAFVLHGLRPDDLFMDVGANVGSYTVLAAGAVGARAICVEPLPSTFARLSDNIRLNDLGERVEAHCCGLSDAPGSLRFTSGLDTMNRVALPGEENATQIVPVSTMDVLCSGRVPRIIKIDVEGHELAVLRGGAQTLSAPGLRAVLMETNGSGNRFGIGDEAIIQHMKDLGFGAYRYDWKTRQFRTAERGDQNTIFLRDAADMTAICQQAPAYALINGTL